MVSTTTFISQTITTIRDLLSSGMTDPISSSRDNRARFVMTSYPRRDVKYPIITVRNAGVVMKSGTGMQSELKVFKVPVEVQVWARNEKEKDELTEQAINCLRSAQYGTNSTTDTYDIHDFKVESMVSIDDEGETGIKRCRMIISYTIVVGG